MSWEESKPEPHPCPCSKGHYTVVHRSDDWGRYEERWAMHCPRCNENYDLYTYHANRKGITETYHAWVPKPLLHELAELRERAEEEKRGLATYLERQYGDRWRQHFSGKTRKAIWTQLTQDGRNYPSLSTFYSHIRHSGLENVLKGYLHYGEAGTVIRILKLKDVELTSRIKKIQGLEQATEKKERHVCKQAVA